MDMQEPHESVTEWILQLQNDAHAEAAQKLWERYMTRLVERARRKLGGTSRKMADEEDVAIIAFENFCRGAKQGRFPKLHDRDDLWQLLLMLTDRRAIDQMRKPSHTSGESSGVELGQLESDDPDPRFALELTDNLQVLIHALRDEQLEEIVMLKMAAHTNEEIAQQLGSSLRTVERKLKMIRKRWRDVLETKRP